MFFQPCGSVVERPDVIKGHWPVIVTETNLSVVVGYLWSGGERLLISDLADRVL